MGKDRKPIRDTTVRQWHPKTLGEYRELARAITDWQGADFGGADTGLCYKHTTTALDAAVWIIRACRGSCQLTRHGATIHVDGETVCYSVEEAFILFCLQLNEYIERAYTISKLSSEYSAFYDVWPVDHKATAFTEAGWSAIEATINFLRVFRDACISTLPYFSGVFVGRLDPHGLANALNISLESAANKLVIEPIPDREIVEWKDRIICEVNLLLPVQDWPDWKINREASTLLNQISAEFGQTLKKRSKVGKGVVHKAANVTDTESFILEAIGTDTLTGPALLTKAGYDYSSHYRSILSNLVKRGILEKTGKGYRRSKSFSGGLGTEQ